jgi:copper/silver efflux system protein
VISRLVAWSARHSNVVIVAALIAAIGAERARRALAHDAIPDLSDPQIGVVAEWMGHSATEVATKVTVALTGALTGIPGASAIRGSSMSGMAYVDVVFPSAAALPDARAEIVRRLERARPRLPPDVRVQVGPLASSTGWVFEYAIVSPGMTAKMSELRRFQTDVLRPALAAIPGVAEVATFGGGDDELRVEVQPDRLRVAGLAFTDVVATLQGAARAAGDISPDALKLLPVGAPAAAPSARLDEVARVRLVEDDMPSGLADFQGHAEAVGGIVIARRGADIGPLIARVKRVLLASSPPVGAQVLAVYDRSVLAAGVRQTLLRALIEEVAVVVAVVLLFLGSVRSALVPLATLPLVLLFTFAGMWIFGVQATVMSLGGIAIALGMAVDADVVALEACHRHLERGEAPHRRARLLAAAASFAPAILTSLVIAALTFLPVLAFVGETGRLLRPLAFTKTLVIAAAALVALVVAPALRDRLLPDRVSAEMANPLTRGLVRIYRPFVQLALDRPGVTLAAAALAVLSCLPLVPRLGGEFLPRIDEGDLLFMPTTLPGVSPMDAAAELQRQDRLIAAQPEVSTVLGKVGRADTATDPAPFSMAETTIHVKPRDRWPKVWRRRWYSGLAPEALKPALRRLWPEETPLTTAELVERLDRSTRVPGWTSAWTAPARARLDMMSTGVRTPVGIRVVAAEPARLDELGAALRALAARWPGTRSAVYESLGGETRLRFIPDAAMLAAHGVEAARAEGAAGLVISGGQIGEVNVEGRRARLRIAPDVVARRPAEVVGEITTRAGRDGAGPPIPLALLGRPAFSSEPALIRAERGELVAYVYVDLAQGTDLLSYVEGAQRAVNDAIRAGTVALRAGERIEWTGQYDLLAAGQRRLRIIAPAVALFMLALLFLQFRSVSEALIVLVSVPFALVGSVWTLFLLGYPLSAPVWVGLLSVMGLAMQTGVVMVVYIDEAFYRRLREGRLRSRADIVAAHAEGTVRRLRPKVMTITTMAAGLLPLLWASGSGAEIMRRVAAPMIGGLLTSAFLTLEVLPVLYTIWRSRQLARAEKTGVPLEVIVGRLPSWAAARPDDAVAAAATE